MLQAKGVKDTTGGHAGRQTSKRCRRTGCEPGKAGRETGRNGNRDAIAVSIYL